MYTSTNSYSLGLQHSRIRGYVLLTLGQMLINNFPFPTPLLWLTGSKTPSYLPFSYLFPQGVRCWQRKWRWSIAWPAALGEGPRGGTHPAYPGYGSGYCLISDTFPIYSPRGYIAGSGSGAGAWLGLQHWGRDPPCLPGVRVWVLPHQWPGSGRCSSITTGSSAQGARCGPGCSSGRWSRVRVNQSFLVF